MSANAQNSLLTIDEVAEVMRVSYSHVQKLTQGAVKGSPTLSSVRIGRRVLVRRQTLDRYIEAVETREVHSAT